VPTASGFGRHRRVYASDADRLLRLITEAITRSGAAAIVHCCAAPVPVDLLAGAGFGAVSFDLTLAVAQAEPGPPMVLSRDMGDSFANR
jgi:hypothetical protein